MPTVRHAGKIPVCAPDASGRYRYHVNVITPGATLCGAPVTPETEWYCPCGDDACTVRDVTCPDCLSMARVN